MTRDPISRYPLRRATNGDPKRPRMSVRHDGADDVLVQAPGCTIRITQGGVDALGNPMTRINVEADGARYAGQSAWWIEGQLGLRVTNVRVIGKEPTIEDMAEEIE